MGGYCVDPCIVQEEEEEKKEKHKITWIESKFNPNGVRSVTLPNVVVALLWKANRRNDSKYESSFLTNAGGM